MTKQLQQEQDRGLDMLSEIITRQKSLVRGIGNQIDVQNEIIEDIGDNMDSTQVRLVRNTRNVERISNKSNSCCYWIIIILLLIAIVVASTV
jgi:syntaxin 8